MSEAIKVLTQNASIGKDGAVYMSKSYTDIVYQPKESDKTANDIIDDIKRKLEEYE